MFRTFVRALIMAAAALAGTAPVLADDRPNLLIIGVNTNPDQEAPDGGLFDSALSGIMAGIGESGVAVFGESAGIIDTVAPNGVPPNVSEVIAVARGVEEPHVDLVGVVEVTVSIGQNRFTNLNEPRLLVSGRLFLVATGAPLRGLEADYTRGELPPFPPGCDHVCAISQVRSHGTMVGRDFGLQLAIELSQIPPAGTDAGGTDDGGPEIAPASGGRADGVGARCTDPTNTFELDFRGFDAAELAQIEDYIISFKEYDHHRMLRSDAQHTAYWYEACTNAARLDRNLRQVLEFMDAQGTVARSGRAFTVEKTENR